MDGTMNQNRSWTKSAAMLLASGFICSVAYLAVTSGVRWWGLRGSTQSAGVDGNRDVAVEAMLSDSEASRIRELVRQLSNPTDATEAAAQLRDHFESLTGD